MKRKRRPCIVETIIFESQKSKTIALAHRTRLGRVVSWRFYSPKAARSMGERLIEFANKTEEIGWQDYEKDDDDD